jgi:hypothetical protein
MKPRNFLTLFAGAALLTAVGCGGGEGKAVATVDGEGITFEEFHEYLMTKPNVRVVVQGQTVEVPVAETLAFQAMQELATRKLIMQMAADEGLLPSEDEIEQEIAFKKKLDPQYINRLKSVGYSMGQIRREVSFKLCEERLLTRGIDVKKDEIDSIIANNPEQFVEKETVSVYQVVVQSDARKQQVDKELSESKPFKNVATQLTQDPQGPRRRYEVARLEEPVKSALNGKPVGFVTDWLTIGGAQVKFYIDERSEEKPIDMTPERREQLRRQMAINYGRQANDLQKQVTERLLSSEVSVSDDEDVLKDMWKRFKESIDKRMKDQATASSTTP